MKTCPFCAEEIQDAAIVCKHCGRELTTISKPAASSPEPREKRRLWPWLAGAFGLLVFLNWIGGQTSTNNGEPLLQITAAKGSTGVSITSRESGGLNRCDVTLLDQGNAEWVAVVPGTVSPSQTVSVGWSDFKASGQPMPGFIGRDRNNFIVSCFVEAANTRRSAGIHF